MLLVTHGGGPLAYIDQRVLVLTILGLLVAMPAVLGMWFVLDVLESMSTNLEMLRHGVAPAMSLTQVHAPRPGLLAHFGLTKQREVNRHPARAWTQVHISLVEDLIYLRSALRQFLIALGAVVGTATLTSGALRSALVAWNDAGFSPSEVILYGLLFTALVAIVYLPVQTALERTMDELVEACYPLLAEENVSAAWYESRSLLRNHLRSGIRVGTGIQAAAAIIAPLAGILVSGFLGGAR
jgi:hypothetical protein